MNIIIISLIIFFSIWFILCVVCLCYCKALDTNRNTQVTPEEHEIQNDGEASAPRPEFLY